MSNPIRLVVTRDIIQLGPLAFAKSEHQFQSLSSFHWLTWEPSRSNPFFPPSYCPLPCRKSGIWRSVLPGTSGLTLVVEALGASRTRSRVRPIEHETTSKELRHLGFDIGHGSISTVWLNQITARLFLSLITEDELKVFSFTLFVLRSDDSNRKLEDM